MEVGDIRVKSRLGAAILIFFAPALMPGQGGPGACCGGPSTISGSAPVDLKGKVERVQITPGEGMPFVTVKTSDQSAKVFLGSMRYLMMQGFNPKVGDEITVRALRMNTDLIALTVTLPAANKTIRLRDEYGRPLWRGGRRGPMW